jgi:hypothetical protein
MKLALVASLALALPALAQTKAADAGALKFGVSFEDDVDGKLFEEWKKRLQTASELMFGLTEGQMWLAEIQLEDKTARGRIYVPAGNVIRPVLSDVNAMGLAMMGGTPVWKIKMVGHPDGHPGMLWSLGTVVVHELGHALWGQLDERDSTQKGWECPDCIMGSDPTKLCGKDTHQGTAPTKCCKELISAKYPGIVFPNPKWKAGTKAPAVKFTVTDRGPKDPSPEFAPFTKDEEKVVKEMEARGRALNISVVFQGDATRERLDAWRARMAEFDLILRLHTKEQFFIARVTVEDRKKAGKIMIEAGCEGDDVFALKSNPETMLRKEGDGWLTVGGTPAWNFARYVLPDWLGISGACDTEACYFNSRVWGEKSGREVCEKCGDALAAKWKGAGVVAPGKLSEAKAMPMTRYEVKDNK